MSIVSAELKKNTHVRWSNSLFWKIIYQINSEALKYVLGISSF